ncbi:Chromosome transmission fidelity protein [Aspergillus sclerotialis]|uniref:Chromosome transmission fidelity protein n=1 Tax=Aspergillus sclerotialis TaxID=2070753 RepID=A0A3A3A0P3_9EURO|nr:Chromosome transmission fidelity protein [Aspergillus sclerotialis]
MPFISSPAAFPPGAPSPSGESQKRSHEEDGSQTIEQPKRQKIMGGFLDDEDDVDDMDAFQDAHLNGQFDIQEEFTAPDPPVELPESLRLSQNASNPAPANEPVSGADSLGNSFSSTSQTTPRIIQIKTCSGKTHYIPQKLTKTRIPYERLIAGRSVTAPGRAKRSYYGIEIHKLMDEAAKEENELEAARSLPPPRPTVQPSIEPSMDDHKGKKLAGAMWTEKYRARKFTELIGDERTHRAVLRWLKGWDPIVFPNLARSKLKKQGQDESLGKTTLAHVCARQAGYEVLEINASDERSRDVVKGRIRDALGTENVKGKNVEVGENKVRKVGRPVCVVVDEADGVVSGSAGAGEGGFMKALIDLVLLDQKKASRPSEQGANKGRKRKGDNFRFLRPLILVCNDVYHPSLRPLRSASIAEMVHVRQAPMENVVQRLKNIFIQEGSRTMPTESEGFAKHLGALLAGNKEDLEGAAAEWVAHKLRNENAPSLKLTKNWLEQRVLGGSEGGSFFKSLNRGGVRDIVDRVFTDGGGFGDARPDLDSMEEYLRDDGAPAPAGFADTKKRNAINRLREMVDATGEHDRCVTECFSSYPAQTFQDDTFLSKPNAAYDWLHFHDTVSSKVYSSQDWELSPYLSQSVVAFHNLFASVHGKRRAEKNDIDEDAEEEHPFSGPRADFAAFEALKENRAIMTGLQSSLSAPLARIFRSTDSLVTDLVPNLMRMLSPEVKPVVVRSGGDNRSVASVRKESERALVQSAVRVMIGLGVTFERVRVENGGVHGGWAYRMEPPLDSLITFSKTRGTSLSTLSGSAPVRYAVRQVLDQEYRKETVRKHSEAISSSKLEKTAGKSADEQKQKNNSDKVASGIVKRDFFGRVIREPTPPPTDSEESRKLREANKAGRKVWVTYHDGFSNAVRKPISMAELLAGL